jgi:phage shock protein C
MKKLLLSADKKIFGVCGGIGDYFELDPALVRLGWIIMTVITGVVPGIIAYVIAAIVIPSKATQNKISKE